MAESGIPALVPASAEAIRSKVGRARVAERHMAPASQERGQATPVQQGSVQVLASVLLGPTATPANPPTYAVQQTWAQHAAHSAAVAIAGIGVALARPVNSVIKICDP